MLAMMSLRTNGERIAPRHGLEFFGTRQSGRGLFQAGDPVRDRDLLIRARDLADAWWKTAPPHHGLRAYARGAVWAKRFGLSRVG